MLTSCSEQEVSLFDLVHRPVSEACETDHPDAPMGRGAEDEGKMSAETADISLRRNGGSLNAPARHSVLFQRHFVRASNANQLNGSIGVLRDRFGARA
jgi:hypothetical protein